MIRALLVLLAACGGAAPAPPPAPQPSNADIPLGVTPEPGTAIAGVKIEITHDRDAVWDVTITNRTDADVTVMWRQSVIITGATNFGGRLVVLRGDSKSDQLLTIVQPMEVAHEKVTAEQEEFSRDESSLEPLRAGTFVLPVTTVHGFAHWRGTISGTYTGLVGGGTVDDYSPSTSNVGGCSKGCRCGNSCISCSKVCRGGESGSSRRRRK